MNIPCPTIENLLHVIKTMHISNGLKTSLSAPLKQALALLNDGNPNNDHGVCDKLDVFINHVNAKAGKRLSHEQAEQLLEEASSIKDNLGC